MTPNKLRHYQTVYEEHKAFLPSVQTKASTDTDGSDVSMLAGIYRNFGVLGYLADSDTQVFKDSLARSADLELSVVRRFDAGEPIDVSLVSILLYKSLLDAIASGNFPVAQELASRLGGRSAIEKSHDHPFDRAFGYALKEMMTSSDNTALLKFEESTRSGKFVDFHGYADVLNAIREGDLQAANAGLDSVVEGHIRQGHVGIFQATVDKDLCVWGLGIMNFARSRSLNVSSTSPLLPRALTVPCKNSTGIS